MNNKLNDLMNILSREYTNNNDILINKEYDFNSIKGYWSNISKNDQKHFLSDCKKNGTLNAIRNFFPNYEDIIFDPTRAVALKFLDIKPSDIGVDYGCMWGNLLLHCARQSKYMIGIDQTSESLEFLNHRLKEEKINNVSLINENLKNKFPFKNNFDFSIVNGVLEWIPDSSDIDLTTHFKTKRKKDVNKKVTPYDLQLKFLKNINGHLKKDGKLYLAIENRWDYQHFLWKRDPHSNLFLTAILPRKVASLVSRIIYGRDYVNYIYSMTSLQQLLNLAGFSIEKKLSVFPDYRFPKIILDMNKINVEDYFPIYNNRKTKNIIKKIFRKIRFTFDIIIYKKMKLLNLAPSFIIIAKKH